MVNLIYMFVFEILNYSPKAIQNENLFGKSNLYKNIGKLTVIIYFSFKI